MSPRRRRAVSASRPDNTRNLGPSRWILLTGPNSYADARQATRRGFAVLGWTVDRSARRGDRVILYGKDPNYAYGFVGRVISDAVLSEANGDYWSYIQYAPCKRPVSLAEAKADRKIASWPRMRMMQGSAHRVPEDIWDRFIARVVGANPSLEKTLERWDRTPPPSPGPSLRHAYRQEELGVQGMREKELERRVRDAWTADWNGRPIEPRDRVRIAASLHLGWAGFADILLVHRRRRHRFILVETKLHAKPGPGVNGVDQLVDYRDWLEARFPDWTVEAHLVAQRISPSVLREAERADIESWEFDDGEFYRPG